MKVKNVVLLATIFQGNITNVFCDLLRSRAIKGERDLQQDGRKQAPPGYNNASKEGFRLNRPINFERSFPDPPTEVPTKAPTEEPTKEPTKEQLQKMTIVIY